MSSKFVLIFRVYLPLICCTLSIYLAQFTFYLTPTIQSTRYSRSVDCQLVHNYESTSRVISISTPKYKSVTSYKCQCVSTDELELFFKSLKWVLIGFIEKIVIFLEKKFCIRHPNYKTDFQILATSFIDVCFP
jgi:hypothetical protein